MQSAGLEDKAKSWIAKGENTPISADEQALPAVVSHVTPDGHVPAEGAVDQALGQLETAAAS
jgi:uncharacterized protein YidB (DUF937 family)